MAGATPAEHRSGPAELVRRLVRSLRYRTRTAPRRARAAVVRRLPPGTHEAVATGRRTLAEGRRAARPKAGQAFRRLPPSNQVQVRRVHRRVQRARGRAVGPVIAVRPRPPRVPKGPPLRTWRTGFRRLLADLVPDGVRWALITPGSPRAIRVGRAATATAFPGAVGRRAPGDDLAHVARLEALRVDGLRLLVVPEGSRPWFLQRAELRGHVTSSYRTVEDRPRAGIVFDLAAPAPAGARSLRAELAELVAALPGTPAVLDWTDAGIAGELPGTTTFRPPEGDRLPYLDRSIEIVVTDTTRDPVESARVATHGVITLVDDPDRPGTVATVTNLAVDAPTAAPRTLVWTADPDDHAGWRTAVTAAAEAAGADLRIAGPADAGPGDLTAHDVVVVLDPYVVPLPASIEAAAASAVADVRSAVAGKVLRPDGRLESAGGTVFGDRSVGLVGRGSPDVRGPWHDYVRPVCWAPGLLAAATSLWSAVPAPTGPPTSAFGREWSAASWAAGFGVTYHPDLTAVRVAASADDGARPLGTTGWQRVLDLRPPRPRDLDDEAWRQLLATDDVEAIRA